MDIKQQLSTTKIKKIPRLGANQILPSYAQQRLWFIDKLEGASPQYNMPIALNIVGAFDGDAAEQAIIRIIERHEPLRTVLAQGCKGPVQIIGDAVDFALNRVDISYFPKQDQLQKIEGLMARDSRKTFDLAQDLMIRASLLTLSINSAEGDDNSVLLFNMHRIACDELSMGIFLKEFAIEHQAVIKNQPDPLPPLAIQYADYAHWQRQWLQGDALQGQLDYWTTQLANLPSSHNLTLDYPRPQVKEHKGAEIVCQMDADFSQRLAQITKDHQMTPFMLFHGVLALVLSRHSNRSDIVIGTPVTNRIVAEVEPMIGLFVNALVLRVNTDQATVADYLTHVRQVNLDAQAHQDISFEQLVAHCKVPRSIQHSPLFQILFTMDDHKPEDFAIPGVCFSPLKSHEVMTQYDLRVLAHTDESGTSFSWTYDTSLFSPSRVNMMAEHLNAVLTAIVGLSIGDQSGAILDAVKMADLTMLSRQQSQYLVHKINDTAVEYPRNVLIHQLFETQAQQNPDHTAVVFDGVDGLVQLSYQQLNETANRLAHHLRKQGVSANTLVGMCLHRSVDMVVGILGIVKAGGAYVPMDPDYPASRLSYLVADTGIKHLLTQSALVEGLGDFEGVEVIALDLVGDEQYWQDYPTDNPALLTEQGTDNLAYVIYTCGSTEQPNGVMMGHLGLYNRIDWMQNHYGLNTDDRVLQKTSFCFDVSVWEFLWPLSYGAQLVMAKPGGEQDPHYLQGLIEQQQVSVMHFVPSMLNTYLATPSITFAPSVRYVFCSGEALAIEHVQAMNHVAGHVALHKLYGPTEAAIDVSHFDCRDLSDHLSVPIGKPIQNIQLLVLDAQLNLCPKGVEGELYIGGDGLAKGYLNQPKLTAERFIKNPYCPYGMTRLYKTGDLVRYLPDGNLAYLGRIDRLLANCDGNKQYIAPQNALQQQLCEIYQSVLGLDKVGIKESFFDLGGDSLLALRVINLVQEYVGETVHLAVIFNVPSVALFAQYLEDNYGEVLYNKGVVLKPQLDQLSVTHGLALDLPDADVTQPLHLSVVPVPRDSNIYPTSSQQRLLFVDGMDGATAQYNLPMALRIEGDFDTDAAELAIHRIVLRHESLRTVFSEHNGHLVQVIVEEVFFKLVCHDLTHFDPSTQSVQVSKILYRDRHNLFDLSTDIMVRANWLQLGDELGILQFNLHQIAADDWSMKILTNEFTSQYLAAVIGEGDPLAPLTVQYADYAHWQKLNGDVAQNQLDYWRNQLDDAPPLHSLPTYPRPSEKQYKGAKVSGFVDANLTAKLEQIATNHHVTLFMLLHGAMGLVLSRHSNTNDIVIGSPVANRMQTELKPLIGFFVNNLVLRTDTNHQDFSDYMAHVKQVNLDAQANQDVPFEQIVEHCNVHRSIGHTPLFQIRFTLITPQDDIMELPGLTLTPVDDNEVVSKFDLDIGAELTPNGIQLVWAYDIALFNEALVTQLNDHLQRLLVNITVGEMAMPQATIQPDHQLPASSISGLIEHWAWATPTAVALSFEGKDYDYATLNSEVNQLAHVLALQYEVGIGTRVAIATHRNAQRIIAILAVLKLGGCFIAMSEELPQDRIDYMLVDSGATLLITDSHFAISHQIEDYVLIDNEGFIALVERQQDCNPMVDEIPPDAVAHIIYTSGPTGNPKGVMGTYGATYNHIAWMLSTLPIEAGETMAHTTSMALNRGVWALLTPLCGGTRLWLCPRDVVR